jgi:hypothetical protein
LVLNVNTENICTFLIRRAKRSRRPGWLAHFHASAHCGFDQPSSAEGECRDRDPDSHFALGLPWLTEKKSVSLTLASISNAAVRTGAGGIGVEHAERLAVAGARLGRSAGAAGEALPRRGLGFRSAQTEKE